MKNQNLIGKKFGRLTVISSSKKVKEGNKFKTAWNCACECGNTILAKTYNLNRGGVLSCGCLRDDLRIKLKPNQTFGRLITLSYNGESVWKCKCECGSICLVKSDKLSSGKTRSCGCLAREISKKNIQIAINCKRKYEPHITSARRIWQNYCRVDKVSTKECSISFDDFFELSQKNCHYCGVGPTNKFNIFSYSYYKGSENSVKNGEFIYNGLDRVDNGKKHTKENCVACCIICNRAKNNRSYDDMIKYIKLLSLNKESIKIEKILEIPKEMRSTVKVIYNQNYSNGDLSIEMFYTISQMSCFYCGSERINKYKDFIYNGLDRIDSEKSHNKDNVVPCCKYCNFAKSKLSLVEFEDWANRIKMYQKEKEPN